MKSRDLAGEIAQPHGEMLDLAVEVGDLAREVPDLAGDIPSSGRGTVFGRIEVLDRD